MNKYSRLLDATLLALILYHALISPYTKVEESFNIQAIHDIINFGVYPRENVALNYDHNNFPGPVPRTFVGSLVIAGITKAILSVTTALGVTKLMLTGQSQIDVQILVRCVLGFANGLGLMKIRDSINKVSLRGRVSKRKGLIGFWYMVMLISQFHILYYSSRTLPNFIALPLVSHAISKLIVGDMSGLIWLAFTGIVFRLEIGLFGVLIAVVSSLFFRQTDLIFNVFLLTVGTIVGIFLTLLVDSYFWGYWLIPELVSFKFNIIDGKSAEWGTEPWIAYFNKYIWQLFRPPIILLLVLPGLLSDPADDKSTVSTSKVNNKNQFEITHPAKNSLRILFVSSLIFIFTMSFQPHKEWRFIIYVVPILTLLAANGFANISVKWRASLFNKLLILIFMAFILVGMILSIVMGYISSFNYPGGDAVQFVNTYLKEKNEQDLLVHMDVASCISGVSKFGEIHNELITYDKTEDEFDLLLIWNNIDILVTEVNLNEIDSVHEDSRLTYNANNWRKLHSSETYAGISIIPIVKLFQAQRRNSNTIPALVVQMFDDFVHVKIDTLEELMKSIIVRKDYLYVYERIHPDQGLDDLIKENSGQVNLASGRDSEENPTLKDIDMDDMKKNLNDEINELEGN